MNQNHVSCPQGHCLATFIIITFMVPCFLLLKQAGLPMGPSNVVPQFWTYSVKVGAVIDFEVSPRVMLMGSQDCLPYIRKQGMKPVVEFWV